MCVLEDLIVGQFHPAFEVEWPLSVTPEMYNCSLICDWNSTLIHASGFFMARKAPHVDLRWNGMESLAV